MTKGASEPSPDVTGAVMKDPVTKAAIAHSGTEPAPSAVIAERTAAARISDETSLRTEGQRATSWLWEGTQRNLALMMIGGFMMAHIAIVLSIAYLLVMEWQLLSEHPTTLTPLVVILTAALGAIASLASSVATSYFSRTNSHKVGGVERDHEGR